MMQKTLAPLRQSTENKTSFKDGLRDLFEILILAILVYLILNAFTRRYQVLSISMEPSLQEGEYLLVNRASHWLRPIERGDIIVFQPPQAGSDDIPLIKRVIGLPGEQVEAHDGRIWINGVALNEPYVSGPMSYQKTWMVPEKAYIVLGDNRNNSSDSHRWGPLPKENLIGKAVFRYWPLDRLGQIQHYDYLRLKELP